MEACAFLHQDSRPEENGTIIALPEDYRIAKKLFEHTYSTGPDEAIRGLVQAAESLQKTKGEFLVADLMKALGRGQSHTYDLLQRALDLGCIGEAETYAKYCFLQAEAAPKLELPKLEEVFRFSVAIPKEP